MTTTILVGVATDKDPSMLYIAMGVVPPRATDHQQSCCPTRGSVTVPFFLALEWMISYFAFSDEVTEFLSFVVNIVARLVQAPYMENRQRASLLLPQTPR
jgi:hypothetical protein